jgi:hypothetical protein
LHEGACQVDNLLDYLQSEPIVLVLLAAVAVTLSLFFILPGLFRPIQVIKVKKDVKIQVKPKTKTKVKEETSSIPTKQFTTIGLLRNWKALIVIVVFLFAAGVGLLYLYVQNTPVLVLPARQFLLLESLRRNIRKRKNLTFG